MRFLLAALAALIVGLFLRRFFFLGARRPEPRAPEPKPQLGCNYADIVSRLTTADLADDKDVTAATGGTITPGGRSEAGRPQRVQGRCGYNDAPP